MDIIHLRGVTHIYPDGTAALREVSACFEKGRKIALLGANGAGKTTLLLHLNGTLRPASGEVILDGATVKYDERSLSGVRAKVGMVFQDPDDQLFAPTVRQDVAFGPANLGIAGEELESRVEHALRSMGIEDCADRAPHLLSHGQKKRAAIAGVMAMEPDVIVVDEPTSGLDPQGAWDIIEVLDELNSAGNTVIVSSHDVDLVAGWADCVYIMHGGEICKSGTPGEIFCDHALVSKAGLRVPTFVQTFREFRARGISSGDSPLTMLDFVETASKPFDVVAVRCALADTKIVKGESVGLVLRNGMLYAVGGKGGCTVSGIAMSDAAPGEDIVVRDVTGVLASKTGRILIIPIPGSIDGGSRAVDVGKIRGLLDRFEPQKSGAMGTSAKAAAGKLGMRCDFEIDVIQSCILAALRGLDVAVLASGGMAERAVLRIEEHNRKNGQGIR
ncbi:MAG TPA: ATP-binding cassette domain-containing protein, partial [Candidatus Methanoperedenaceae archaeon]|nr:ATP-binding cassette domain-containing protein [Candidatus Methanoperedenaceae archaeon]